MALVPLYVILPGMISHFSCVWFHGDARGRGGFSLRPLLGAWALSN